MNIFLDLEETVIDEFSSNPRIKLFNCQHIRDFVKKIPPTVEKRFLVFSFAIYSEEDVQQFIAGIKTPLEGLLGFNFGLGSIITVPSMMECSHRVNKPRLRFDDISEFLMDHGKENAFHDWCHGNHVGEVNILIDDVVHNRTTIDDDTHTVVKTINVEGLNNGRL